MYVERCPRLEHVGRGLFEGEEAVLHVIGLPRWALAVHAFSLRLAAPRRWPGGRPVADRAEGALCPPSSLAQGIPRAAMSPGASGGRTVEPVTEEDSDAQRDLFDGRLT